MATFRERALAVASSHSYGRFCVEEGPISPYFGQNVFTVETMRRYLPARAFASVLEARGNGLKIERGIADEIASGMKTWAIERGATHYTHLFQPLTGAIPSRVIDFMKDFETEAYKLGIPLQTRHNEVAPGQFECAPVFSEITQAIDQNMLLMIVMQKVAEKHHLKVIFHEKPFQGINGSGKHCNWSLCTDKGTNLLSPGKTPQGKLRFLTFYSSVLRALSEHGYLLMASVCSLGNSWRLGGNEAPPAILSVFSGSTLPGCSTPYSRPRTPTGETASHNGPGGAEAERFHTEAGAIHIAA